MFRKTAIVLGLSMPAWAWAAVPLTPDDSFGQGGLSRADLSTIFNPTAVWGEDADHVYSLSPEHTGNTSEPRHHLTRRLATDGSLDASFGTNGTATIEPLPAGGDQYFRGLCTDPASGVIYLVGTSAYTEDAGFDVYKLLADGTPDAEWGVEGYLRIPRADGSPDARGCVVQADGKLVVVGADGSLNADDYGLTNYAFAARLTIEGVLDGDFGVEGVRRFIPFSGSPQPYFTLSRVTVGPSNTLFMAGEVLDRFGQESDVIVAKMTPAGALASYGSGGVVRLPAGGVGAIRPQPGGSLVIGVVGYTNSPDFAVDVRRLTSGGQLDATYGCNGVKSGSGSFTNFVPFAASTDSDGRVLLLGTEYTQSVDYETVIRTSGLPEFSATGASGNEVAAGCGSGGGGGGSPGLPALALLALAGLCRRAMTR